MRRKSVKKSSMFKVQQEKIIFKKYLDNIENCTTARAYPDLLNSLKKTSQVVYNYCYEFGDQNPFTRGLNYGCKTFGLSFPTSTLMVIREWVPNAKEVYLLGDFNEFNQTSHPMRPVEGQKDIYILELDIAKNHINDQSRILLKIIDNNGKVHRMPPPSCKIRQKDFGYVCVYIQCPTMKHQKKHDIIMAYTIDLSQIPLSQTLLFIQKHGQFLQNFNTIILRGLFDSNLPVMDKGSLTLQEMKQLRDIINKVKNQMGLKIILEWSLESGKLKYQQDNPIQKQLLKQQEGAWHYDLQKQQVMALYLANLSYYLTIFQIDGYHFKRIDSFCKDQNGQILVKCLNIMNSRLHENGFTLASCKKQVPGLDHSILEGGLGFTFTYNYNQNFLQSKDHLQLKQKFDKILESSNCVAINLDELTLEHELNFLFAVLVSGKGIFCKGSLDQDKKTLLNKLFTLRRQPELFGETTQITKISNTTLQVQRGKTYILFNFGKEESQQKVEDIHDMEFISCFSRKEPVISENSIKLEAQSCCVFER